MLLKRPQHIKRRCTQEEFESIENGSRTNDMRIANVEINVGDFITYIEVDEEGNPTGSETIKKITNIINTKELDPHVAEIEKYGFSILSFTAPEANTLRAVFADHFAMACVVKKQDTDWSIIGGPQHWPLLICPDLTSTDLLDNLKIPKWPDGIYSIHLKIEPEMDESKDIPVVHLGIADTFVFVCTLNEDDEEEQDLICVDVDVGALLLGNAISVYGNPIYPAHPEDVEKYYMQDASVLNRINDGMFSILPELNMPDEEFAEFLEEEIENARGMDEFTEAELEDEDALMDHYFDKSNSKESKSND